MLVYLYPCHKMYLGLFRNCLFGIVMGILHIVHSSRETYNALTNWLTDARTLASPNIVIILVGNKKDLEAEREVTFLEASRFAQENGNLNCKPQNLYNYLWSAPSLVIW